MVLGVSYLVYGIWIWYLVLGIWHLVLGAWSEYSLLGLGVLCICYLVYCTWYFVIWKLIYDICIYIYMVLGVNVHYWVLGGGRRSAALK